MPLPAVVKESHLAKDCARYVLLRDTAALIVRVRARASFHFALEHDTEATAKIALLTLLHHHDFHVVDQLIELLRGEGAEERAFAQSVEQAHTVRFGLRRLLLGAAIPVEGSVGSGEESAPSHRRWPLPVARRASIGRCFRRHPFTFVGLSIARNRRWQATHGSEERCCTFVGPV